MNDRVPEYPFVPRSTASLRPGQFWALPLSDGSFGCARVLQLAPPESVGARRIFLAGVMDWHSTEPPSSECLAGAPCIAQGAAHIKAITQTGGALLGHRGLEHDGLEPWMFREAGHWRSAFVVRGLEVLRPQRPEDSDLAVRSHWGYMVAKEIAEERFVRGLIVDCRAPDKAGLDDL